jgi:exosortase/archaeosortase family protein
MLIAGLIAFACNSLRVAILAILIAQGQKPAFDYWHGNSGGWLFSVMAITIFASFCWYAVLLPQLKK